LILQASKREIGAAVWAMSVEQAEAAISVSKEYQFLAQ
jgi:hypothetical protein